MDTGFTPAAEPESWDEATDYRRYWWVLPPILFALVAFAIVRVTDSPKGQLFSLDDEVRQSYTVGAAPELVIENVAGDITIRTGPEGTIDVRVRRTGLGRDNDAAFENLTSLELRLHHDRNRVTIATRDTRSAAREGRAAAAVEVVVPPGTTIDLVTGAGEVTIAPTTADIRAENANGTITVTVAKDDGFNLYSHAALQVVNVPVEYVGEANGLAHRVTVNAEPARDLTLISPLGEVWVKTR